jgi:hypothetical protein
VLTTIELDHQLGFRAAEVRNERSDGMLAPESRTAQPSIAKPRPQFPLRIRL